MYRCCSTAKDGGAPTPADPSEHLLVILLEVGRKVLAPDVLNSLVCKDGLPPLHPALAPQLVCQVLQRVTWALPVPLRTDCSQYLVAKVHRLTAAPKGSACRCVLHVMGWWSQCCLQSEGERYSTDCPLGRSAYALVTVVNKTVQGRKPGTRTCVWKLQSTWRSFYTL